MAKTFGMMTHVTTIIMCIWFCISSGIVNGKESHPSSSLRSSIQASVAESSKKSNDSYNSKQEALKNNYDPYVVDGSRKLSGLQSQYRLRGGESDLVTTPNGGGGSNAEESLKLLQQMEQLKLQLEALVAKKDGTGSPVTSSVGQQQQHQMYPQQQRPMMTHQRIPDRVATSQSGRVSGGKCGGGDAFAGQPIDGWTPPPQARLEDTQKWEDARTEVSSIIAHFNRGGKPLRELIHKEVSALKLLRQKLFCQYM